MKKIVCILSMLFLISFMIKAQETAVKNLILITNAVIFDGQNEKLAEGMSVLVEGNKIAKIAKTIPAPKGAQVIDAKEKPLCRDLPMRIGMSCSAPLLYQCS